MIKYLGSKRVLVPEIVAIVASLPRVRTVIDLFSGTSRVGHALKRAGYRVLANDLLTYAHALATCYVQADAEDLLADAAKLLAEFSRLRGRAGYFTRTFCEESRFFQPHNGERIDAIREAIERKDLDPELKAVVLVSLMEAADRVDSTTGVQMAYVKRWAPRSFNPLELRLPDVLARARHGKGAAFQGPAEDAVDRLEADVAYLDPPYNQHSYLGNYHIWETLVRWDKPPHYGVACKRADVRERPSAFNRKRDALDAMRRVIERVRARYLVVSFNDEGYIGRTEMEELLSTRGRVTTIARGFRRYVGARIGIYNPKGEKVGRISHTTNTEYLYVVTPGNARWNPPSGP